MSKAALEQYEDYRNSECEWLGRVPEHWKVARLKDVAFLQYSNVDKLSEEGEMAVELCNYVDVYKNDFIDSSLEFMQATANASEIRRFSLRKHDVLVTKDSETSDDIAIPALVLDTLPGVLCGYHLAQIRVNKRDMYGPFLFRLLQSVSYSFRFVIYAKGITRVGLSTAAFSDALTPIPPFEEQKAIADYLDINTAQIDRKIDLLTQKVTHYIGLKQSLINETLTRGLDKSIPLEDVGVGWIGKAPSEWNIVRAKDIFKERNQRTVTGNETLLTVSHITGVTPRSEKNVNMFMAESMEGYKLCYPGDLVINTMWAWMGALGTSKYGGICSPSYNVYMPRRGIPYNPRYFDYLFRTPNAIAEMTRHSKGIVSSRLRLYARDFFQISIALPSLETQTAIADYLDTKTAQIDRIVETIHVQIEKLKELRRALINDVVIGKIKVIQP